MYKVICKVSIVTKVCFLRNIIEAAVDVRCDVVTVQFAVLEGQELYMT